MVTHRQRHDPPARMPIDDTNARRRTDTATPGGPGEGGHLPPKAGHADCPPPDPTSRPVTCPDDGLAERTMRRAFWLARAGVDHGRLELVARPKVDPFAASGTRWRDGICMVGNWAPRSRFRRGYHVGQLAEPRGDERLLNPEGRTVGGSQVEGPPARRRAGRVRPGPRLVAFRERRALHLGCTPMGVGSDRIGLDRTFAGNRHPGLIAASQVRDSPPATPSVGQETVGGAGRARSRSVGPGVGRTTDVRRPRPTKILGRTDRTSARARVR